MSIDSLGRVIVGSGHFSDQVPRVMENVSRLFGEERNFTHMEKATTQLDRGVRNIWNSAKHVDKVLGEKLYDLRFPHNYDGSGNILSRWMKDSSKQEAAHQQAAENLERLGEVGEDLLKALGWGLGGNPGESMENAATAAGKMAEIFWRGLPGPGMGSN